MRKLVTIVQTVGEDDSDSEIFNRKELSAAEPQPKVIRTRIINRRGRKERRSRNRIISRKDAKAQR